MDSEEWQDVSGECLGVGGRRQGASVDVTILWTFSEERNKVRYG